jgi:hypothetical protein
LAAPHQKQLPSIPGHPGATPELVANPKALNFQGKEAERFKDLFLRNTLAEVDQPEPAFPVMNLDGSICPIPAHLWGHEVPSETKSIGRSVVHFDIRGYSWSCSRRSASPAYLGTA